VEKTLDKFNDRNKIVQYREKMQKNRGKISKNREKNTRKILVSKHICARTRGKFAIARRNLRSVKKHA
jgi:hypothetical protein